MSTRKKNKIGVIAAANRHHHQQHGDLNILHTTCDDVLRTLHLLSKVTPKYPSCDELGENLHQLGITLSSLDRTLRHFICDVLLSGTDIDPRLSLDSGLKQALKLSQQTPTVKRTSLLRGGVASHLFLFSLVLRRARAAIRGADLSEYHKNSSIIGRYTSSTIVRTISGLTLLQLGRVMFKSRPRSRSAWYAAVVAGTFTWWWITWYQTHRHVQELVRSNTRLLYLLRMWTVVNNVVHQAQLRRATSYVQLFKPQLSSPLGKSLQFNNNEGNNTNGSENLRTPSKGHAAKSFLSLVAIPHDEDHEGHYLTLSSTTTNRLANTVSSHGSSVEENEQRTETIRGLLRVAPTPTKFAFWYDDLLADGNYISRWGIKHGLNVLYASCYIALKYVGPYHYKTFGRIVQSFLIPYYGLQPNLAASTAHAFLSQADATDIQMAWSPMMHDMAIPIALAMHTRGLSVAKLYHMEYNTIKTEAYVFSAHPIEDLDHSNVTVLFYFFGGGFIGNLFAADIQFISNWTKAMPNVVIVCPQYSLCPFPYPRALNECEAAYNAVMHGGALGFVPKECVLSGQSAGGNLAAALTVRRVQHHRKLGIDDSNIHKKTPPRVKNESGRPPRPPLKSPTSPTASSSSTSSTKLIPTTSKSSTLPNMKIKGLVMWYPTLNMSQAPSPSRVLFVSDVLLPLPLTNAAAQNYCPNLADSFDPCCSPVFADDDVLSKFPQTYIMAAGLDPLLDDSVDFHTRLTRNKTPAKLKIWRGLPHGFLGMGLVNSEAASALSGSLDALKEIC